ncbi:MAG: DUF5915 domain-containing protein, partial [Patescibacteria group bacterium]
TAILLAPFTPFLSEWLYQNLSDKRPLDFARGRQATSDKESVHLEKYPKAVKTKKLEVMKVMDKARELVALGLAERARAGIRVRQPLNALYISPADYNLVADVVYVIAEELNVKKVLAERKVAQDTVSLDTELTAELKEEGLVRELTRQINEMRKEAGLTPNDKIISYYDLNYSSVSTASRAGDFRELLARWEEVIKKETRSAQIHFGITEHENFLIHKVWNHDGYEVGVGIKKA